MKLYKILVLLAVILPAILFAADWMDLNLCKGIMLGATILWFLPSVIGIFSSEQ